MIPETKVAGPLRWQVIWTGIRGGVIKLHIVKNRVSFVKKFVLKDKETFETAQKICREKVPRILHLKNHIYPDLALIANYCLEATSVEESQDLGGP